MPNVQLFATCLIEHLRPEAGLAAVAVLERLGFAVEVPDRQTCCGQPAFNGGLWDEARAMARHTLDVLAGTEGPIVVPSGSCAEMIRHHYLELFAGDPVYGPRAESVAARVHEFAQFLVDAAGVADVGARFPGRVAYHASCHLLRGLQVEQQPRLLLAAVRHLELKELPGATDCCGFGGLFAVKMAEISGAMLERKLDNIAASGAEYLVGCDVSCLIHIAGGLHRRGAPIQTRHLAEILAER